MNDILAKISEIGIVPVIKLDDENKAVPLAKALWDGGIPCAEVTFRTASAAAAISKIATTMPEMLLGAGTVTTIAQVDSAIAAGAKFIVSPGLNPKIVSYCIEKNIPITPGCSSPSDIEKALELGLDVVKFFPAEASGGLAAIKAMAAPYTTVKFMPTGGITEKNITDYLAFPKIIACGGSWMVDPALVDAGDFDAIRRLCEKAVATVLGFRLAHVGINANDDADAVAIAQLFCMAFGLELKDGVVSTFAGSAVEVMKPPYLGEKGHIGFSTNSIPRAMRYLRAKGFAFNESSIRKDAQGNITVAYLEKDFAGFAVHIVAGK